MKRGKMKYDNEEWVAPALAVIGRTDPPLHARMQASPWQVNVIATFTEQALLDLADRYGPQHEMSAELDLAGSFGITFTGIPGSHLTFINRPEVERAAAELSVPAADFLADILVHEFAHETDAGTSEMLAFRASTAFGRRLGVRDAPIAELSEATGRMTENGA